MWGCLLLLTGNDHCRLLLWHLLGDAATTAHCTTAIIGAHKVLVWLRCHHLRLTALIAFSMVVVNT